MDRRPYSTLDVECSMLDVLQRFGLKSGSLLKRALTSLMAREVVTKNKTHHIQDAMLKKWVQHTMAG